MPSLLDDRRQRRDTPLDVLRASSEWQPVVGLIDAWARVPLAPSHGYAAEELDRIEAETGVMFPPVLREWWRLAGKHPLVAEIGDGDTHSFWLPGRVVPRTGPIIPVTIVDAQAGVEIGIHRDFAGDPDPPTHGVNPIGSNAVPSLTESQLPADLVMINVPAWQHADAPLRLGSAIGARF
jgi:hypothetical protein